MEDFGGDPYQDPLHLTGSIQQFNHRAARDRSEVGVIGDLGEERVAGLCQTHADVDPIDPAYAPISRERCLGITWAAALAPLSPIPTQS
jgi:hypothetical protein